MTTVVAALADVTVQYGDRVGLDRVSLEVRAGERVGILGASGAGKSTLLGVLGGLVTPTSGTVRLLGEDVGALTGRRQRAVRARVGTIHQQLHLTGPLRVVHNVNAGRLGEWPAWKALWSLVRPQEVAVAQAALARLGLADRLHDRTDTLSGGQLQRVALARLLAQEPDLVLADEPVSALDPTLVEEVVSLLTTVVATDGRALVVSLHDVELARRWCDRLVGLADGRVVFDARPHELAPEALARLYGSSRP